MGEVFFKLLNMSLTAVWLMAAVLILRPLLKRYSSMLCMAAWSFVGLRLLCPLTLESVFSLIPSGEPLPMSITTAAMPQINSGSTVVNETVNQVLGDSFAPTVDASINPLQLVAAIATIVWVLGMVAMLIYGVIGMWRIRRRTRTAIPLEDTVWIGDDIGTPFVSGLFRPRIYLPSSLPEEDREWVIAHERSHIRWGDMFWKLLAFLTLGIHWFNPFVWVAYFIFCRDLESACDERVMNDKSLDERKAYSSALVRCATPHRLTLAPLAFGEVNVKTRVKTVLSFKKPALWITIAACVLLGAAVLCWFFNPVSTIDPILDYKIGDWILAHHQGKYLQGQVPVEHHEVLDVRDRGDTITVYMWVLYEEYSRENGELVDVSGAHIPTVIVAEKQFDGAYVMMEYWEAEDGDRYVPSIRERFPMRLWRKATDSQAYIDKQTARCRATAEQLLGTQTNAQEVKLCAVVKEVQNDTMIVTPFEAESLSGEISLSTETLSTAPTVGDTIIIYYDGRVQETYPMQLPNVYRIDMLLVGEESVTIPTTTLKEAESRSPYEYVIVGENNSFEVFGFDGTSIAFHRGVASTPSAGFLNDSIVSVSWDEGADRMTCYYDLENHSGTEPYTNVICESGETIYYTEQYLDGVYLVKRQVFPRAGLRETVLLEEAYGTKLNSFDLDDNGGIVLRYYIGDGTTLRTLKLSSDLAVLSSEDQPAPRFYAVVEEIHGGLAFVHVSEGQSVESGPMKVYYDTLNEIAEVGDTVIVYYDGTVLTSYPPQVHARYVEVKESGE